MISRSTNWRTVRRSASCSWVKIIVVVLLTNPDRCHALRGNAALDALRPLLGRRASRAAFPRGARERSTD
ncbi:hypothetical protein C1886_06140 [Pseudomonas sp. FW300-N1A1]|nr:hypothetical protein C1886_06140 [Pseudomonas sp. FW300-N1A1]